MIAGISSNLCSGGGVGWNHSSEVGRNGTNNNGRLEANASQRIITIPRIPINEIIDPIVEIEFHVA